MKEIKDLLGLKEVITVEVFRHRPEGGYYAKPELIQAEDLIVNTGRIHLAKRIVGGDTVSSAMAYMAIGSGSTAPALTQTTLVHEVARKAFASESTTNNVWSAVNTFGGAADGVTSIQIVEAGIFNHASSGEMFQRVTFAAVTLANSDLLKLTLQTNVGSNTI